MRLLLLVLLLGLSHTAFAATVVGATVQVNAFAGGPEEDPGLTDSNQFSGPQSGTVAAISPHAGASADAFADFGVVKVSGQANSQSGGYIGIANATGQWTDIVTLSSGAFNGLQARITGSVTLQGFISPVGTGRGNIHMEFDMGNAGTSVNGAWDNDTPVNATGFPAAGLSVQPGGTLFYSNIHEVTLSIVLGNSFVLKESLALGAVSKPVCQTSNPACLDDGGGAVDVDFGHSSYWSGITSIKVRNASGIFVEQDLSQFTLSSNSGTDYFQSFVPNPVPLPAAAWLFAPALSVLAAMRRRQRGWREQVASKARARFRGPGAA